MANGVKKWKMNNERNSENIINNGIYKRKMAKMSAKASAKKKKMVSAAWRENEKKNNVSAASYRRHLRHVKETKCRVIMAAGNDENDENEE